jgi:hypothetical protein
MAERVAEVTAKSDGNTASADTREAPVMKSNALEWQSEGFQWKEAIVRLAEGVIFQDLEDASSGIWKNIQGKPQTALGRLDRVTCVAFDETWLVKDVVVVYADNARVVLAFKPSDRIALPSNVPKTPV